MPSVSFTSHLRKFFPGLAPTTVAGATVAEVVAELDRLHPGLAAYIIDEQGALRKHVNIFISNDLISDRRHLLDRVADDDQIYIMQALSGG
ncbi:MAG: molybdenum cofactor biosynthesis protein MoaD [Chlorobi bacterium]|nr:molybdenum cofactor biosynthesis protein MoaD [Chlorobiota bacterium]